MIFYGNEKELADLKEYTDNSVEAVLINAFNAGYKSYNRLVEEQYNQANAAVEQGIIASVPANNAFIGLLQKYIRMEEAKNSAKEEENK